MMRLILALFFFFFQKLTAHEVDLAPRTLFKHRDDTATWEVQTDNNSTQELHYHEIDSHKENISIKIYGKNQELREVIEAYQKPYEKHVRYAYSQDGLPSQITKANGVVLNYTWNDHGELTALRSSDGTVDQSYFYYDGYLASATNHITGKKTLFSLDDETKTSKETFENGLTVAGQFNEKGQRIQFVYPDQSSVAFEYSHDLLQAVQRISPEGRSLYTHTYNSYNTNGKVTSAYLIEGLGLLTYRYDENNRCTEILHDSWRAHVSFDENANVHEIHTRDLVGETKNLFFYDSHQQLIHEDSLFEKSYGYDTKHNLTYSEGEEFAYNELYQIIDPLIKYDDNGNMIQHGNFFYSYDALDRLVSIETDHDRWVHVYDPFDRRITTRIYQHVEDAWIESDCRHYIYDGCREIGCADSSGNIIQLRILGTGIGEDVGSAIAIELNQRVYAPIHDRLGSIVTLIDTSTGQTAETYRYSAFGERQIYDRSGQLCPKCPSGNPWGFRSKRQDREDLIYFGKRYYKPKLHTWMTKDPLGSLDAYNPYQFALNNPLSHHDYYGLYSVGEFCSDSITWAMHRLTLMQAFVRNIDKVVNPEGLSVLNYVRPELESLCQSLFGNTFLLMMGFWKEPISTSVYGEAEVSDKIRITSINGILNLRKHCQETAQLISRTHGGIRVHYIHRPTAGWASDILNCLTVKMGHTSPAAQQLAEKWKELIQEMGGTEAGGRIIHYAHSIGGTDTLMAKQYMTPEELKMIQVISLGSATIIPDRDFYSVKNYISWRDGVPYLDPFGYVHALVGKVTNTLFLGTPGLPVVDHGVSTGTYKDLLRQLGDDFIKLTHKTSCSKSSNRA